ncbi:YicC/YloC family endoribonuclease [Acuticoccus sp. MNP-M23]|uniref:YicC/YloC family endoribonuclease n=1 Tax=Acuticoccus sp. MNP-M23 TaxID=3072793 RepID=UPI002814DA10|nr:YicC/YloC family endoribonuclease [Acuticoccus sp. MNP-M23]WMS41278.1 YicC/YloC family endoribonuclease [Acuticoccus sp. MNP-M23]
MAAIQSMTGFASREGEIDGLAFQIDARSVNNRALDVRLRVPQGFERQEAELRKAVAATFRRGSVNLTVSVKRAEVETRFSVNHTQLMTYVDAIAALAESGSVAAPRADGLLALRGVIEAAEGDETVAVPDMMDEARQVLAALEADRLEEGARIRPVLEDQLRAMDRLREAIDAHPERALPAIRARIERQIAEMLSGARALSDERLHQEAALLATRADVREELDRLAAHIAAARALLAEGGAVGRKLDFLSQELNRETNTICAKAPHHAITALGLELKAVVEQLREQVQNLE